MGERPEFKCRRDEDQGADEGRWGVDRGGCDESGMWGWVSPSPLGTGLGAVPPPQKKKRFCISNRRILVQTECILYSSS